MSGTPEPQTAQRRAAAARRGAGRVAVGAGFLPPWQVTLTFLALLLPTETQYFIGSVRLDPPRTVIALLMVPAAFDVFGGRFGRARPSDWCMLGWVVWVSIAFGVVHGIDRVAEWGPAYAIEALGGYLVGRRWVRDAAAFAGLARLAVVSALVFVVPNVFEALTRRNLLHEVASAALGGSFANTLDQRFGLNRSYGPFPHPILNGVLFGSVFSLAWHAYARGFVGRAVSTLGVAVCAMASVSSAAAVTLGAQTFMIVWERLTRRIQRRWLLLGTLFVVGYGIIGAISNRTAMRVLLNYLTFDPVTAYNRQVIWEQGVLEIVKSPLVGIGFNDWDHPSYMSSSIDAFWLAVPMMYGLPAGLCMYGAVGYALAGATRRATWRDAVGRQALAWSLSLFGFIVAGVTVHFWGSAFVWLCMFVGAGIWFRTDRTGPPAGPGPVRRDPRDGRGRRPDPARPARDDVAPRA